jgi:ribosomal protein S20
MQDSDEAKVAHAVLTAIHAGDAAEAKTALADVRRLLKFGQFAPSLTTTPAPAGRGRLALLARLRDAMAAIAIARQAGDGAQANTIIVSIVNDVTEAARRGLPGKSFES